MNVAIITGASSGMGREFVKNLDKNFDVDELYVVARRKELLDELTAYTKAKVVPLPYDLTEKESFEKYEQFLSEQNPNVVLLINCAGFGKFDEFTNTPLEINKKMVDLNCNALQMITYLTIPYMREESKIVQMASMSSFQPVPYIGLYAGTKAFVLSFSRSLNEELKRRKIHVMALCPYWVKTNFFDIAKTGNPELIDNFDIVYTPEFIVQKCYKALSKKKIKDVCIPGFASKLQVFFVKLLPHSLVIKVWLKKQKIKKKLKY